MRIQMRIWNRRTTRMRQTSSLSSQMIPTQAIHHLLGTWRLRNWIARSSAQKKLPMKSNVQPKRLPLRCKRYKTKPKTVHQTPNYLRYKVSSELSSSKTHRMFKGYRNWITLITKRLSLTISSGIRMRTLMMVALSGIRTILRNKMQWLWAIMLME